MHESVAKLPHVMGKTNKSYLLLFFLYILRMETTKEKLRQNIFLQETGNCGYIFSLCEEEDGKQYYPNMVLPLRKAVSIPWMKHFVGVNSYGLKTTTSSPFTREMRKNQPSSTSLQETTKHWIVLPIYSVLSNNASSCFSNNLYHIDNY